MSEFIFRDAALINKLALVGISGQSRSGKTLSALRIAKGLAEAFGSKIAAIDTEAGRMLEYGPGAEPFGFEFKYCQLDPPFTGERYLAALQAAEEVAGPDGVVVCDSMSHEHEGEGGVLDRHGTIVAERGPQWNGTAWKEAKAGRNKLLAYVRSRRRCHWVLCFRADKKTPMLPNGKFGEPFIDLIGWSGWPFEMSMFVMLNQENRGCELRHDTTAGLDRLLPKGQLTEATGHALAQWCRQNRGGAPKDARLAAPAPTPGNRKADQARVRFMASLEKANDFGSLAELDHKLGEHRALLGEHYDECATALQAKVDAMRAAAATEFADEIERLEPDEWKNREGRDEDARHPELLP